MSFVYLGHRDDTTHWRALAHLDLRKGDAQSMKHKDDDVLCEELGLTNGQRRKGFSYRNLLWSFDHDRTSFGSGDLDPADLASIYKWLSDRSSSKVFTGWDKNQLDKPIVRISYGAGITYPKQTQLDARYDIK